MEFKLSASGRTRVIYKVPSIRMVCRGAFKKVYIFSNAKIKVLLRKIQTDGVSIDQDMRGSGSVFASGQPSSSQVTRAPIPIRVRDPIALEMSSSMNWTSSSAIIELDITFTVPRRE